MSMWVQVSKLGGRWVDELCEHADSDDGRLNLHITAAR